MEIVTRKKERMSKEFKEKSQIVEKTESPETAGKPETARRSHAKSHAKASNGDTQDFGALLCKILFIAVLAGFLVFVYSRASAKDVDLEKVETKLTETTDIMTLMTEASDRDLMQFIGLDASSYEQVIYYRNTTALAVEELLIVKAKDESQLSDVEDAVNARIKSQIKAYDSYGPAQVKQLKNALQLEKGKYYFYCTGDNANKYEEVLLNAVQ